MKRVAFIERSGEKSTKRTDCALRSFGNFYEGDPTISADSLRRILRPAGQNVSGSGSDYVHVVCKARLGKKKATLGAAAPARSCELYLFRKVVNT